LEETRRSGRKTLAAGRKELTEVIETCEAIERRKFNPFFLDVKLGVDTLREYFPLWTEFQDNCLDAHALNRLSEVVRLQNTQLKFQSSALYAEPEFVAKKFERMSEKRLAEVFLQSWHPIAELEQLTNEAISSGLDYWNLLRPIQERWKRRDYSRGKNPDSVDSATLTGLGIHGEKFEASLMELWKELVELHKTENGPLDYWKFVKMPKHQETVRRAYFVSFLVTYGFAKMQLEGERITLLPMDQPTNKPAEGGVSVPIAIPSEA